MSNLASPSLARADGTSQLVLAESLFEEGKRLMLAGQVDEACPKLGESYKIDQAGGTLMALALCHEKQGKVATAWAEYKRALAVALRTRRSDREQVARERIDALSGELPRLVVKVAPGADDGALELSLDGASLPRAAWGTPLPVDPGPHVVEASSRGRISKRLDAVSAVKRQTTELVVPALEPVREPPPAAPTATEAPGAALAVPAQGAPSPEPAVTGPVRSGARHGTLTLGLGIGGGVALVGAAALGGYALSKSSSAHDVCPTSSCNDAGAIADNRSADRAATAANVAFAVGVVSATAALVVWWLDRDSAQAAARPLAVRF